MTMMVQPLSSSLLPRRLFLLVAVVLTLIGSSNACGNNAGEKIIIRLNSAKQPLRCRKVRNNPQVCKLIDLRSGKRVKRICRDQCLSKCQLLLATRVSPPIPSGPYFTPGTNSQVIKLPEPLTPRLVQGSARTSCPHSQTDLKSWHDPSIWPNKTIPQDGRWVTLPSNTKVVIRQTVVEKLGIITIPSSSELIIGEAVGGIKFVIKGIDVKGKLTIGSETCRIETPVSITLWGKRPSTIVQTPQDPKHKGIYVTGTLSLHGKRYFSTWSRLAKTIEAGEKVLLLQRPVNWELGHKVVLTTSIIYDSRSYHQNEVVTVDRVETAANTPAGVGAVVYLQQAVQYKHIANKYYQVEAGLLSRTIIVQGNRGDSEPVDLDPLTCRTQGYSSWHLHHNTTMPCTNKEKTGYGGHIMVSGTGKAQVEGIELYRMGQTNVIGRYPMHMHLLKDCPTCYFKDSSIHRSFYRCISVHGTHSALVSENVAFDVIGYCYYLEDGVEQDNTISFNLAAHIHTIGPDMPTGSSQHIKVYDESAALGNELTLPADATASGFYITNVHNNIIGNAASGGWSGFAFPVLDTPLGLHKKVVMRPGCASGLTIDGNTAHSTGYWWEHAGALYFGGSFYYTSDGKLHYNPGRGGMRQTCAIAPTCSGTSCRCRPDDEIALNVTNTKTFLTAGVGINSWTGMMNVDGFEAYDQQLAIEALSRGFWLNNMYAGCRTGEDLGLPYPATADKMKGSGFTWYDTSQSHIITNAVFKNCGYRADAYNQYGTSPTRGCGDRYDKSKGCKETSTTFGFLTHSDEHIPEIMQATRGLTFTDGGRRFLLSKGLTDSISGRCQNWLDVDGSASGLNEPVIIGSGLPSVKDWWGVDNKVVFDTQGPLSFIKKNDGPSRGVGHVRFLWDPALHAKTDVQYCFNGSGGPCPIQGYVRHAGYKFSPARSGVTKGFPVAVNPDTTGPVGGFGWIFGLNGGAPRDLNVTEIEVDPGTPLLLSIAYPVGTVVTVTANVESYCRPRSDGSTTCREFMTAVSSIDLVRNGDGNVYHMDANGVLTMRIFMLTRGYTGDPSFLGVPTYDSPGKDGIGLAIPRFEKSGIILPDYSQTYFRIQADCGGTGVFCSGSVANYDPDVCKTGYQQVAYDKCCSTTYPSRCTFADGSTTT